MHGQVEWPGGVAPPGSRRSRREPLGSPGSCHPAVGRAACQWARSAGSRRCTLASIRPCPWRVAAQPLVLLHGPPYEVVVDASEQRDQLRPVEAAVVVDPASHDRVDRPCEVGESEPAPQVQPPALDRATDLLDGAVRDGGAEADEEAAASAPREAGTKRVAEEVEPLVLV